MTNEEAKKLRGTEFTYSFEDGDRVQAFIAEVDLTKPALTCKALTRLTDRDKYPLWDADTKRRDPKNYDNIYCAIPEVNSLEEIVEDLENMCAGKYEVSGKVGSMNICAF